MVSEEHEHLPRGCVFESWGEFNKEKPSMSPKSRPWDKHGSFERNNIWSHNFFVHRMVAVGLGCMEKYSFSFSVHDS